MGKKALGYSPEDQKEAFAKFYDTAFTVLPDEVSKALANPLTLGRFARYGTNDRA